MNLLRDNLFTPEELAQSLDLSPATLAGWRSERRGPPFIKVGRRIWYPKETFNGWMLGQLQETLDVAEKPKWDLALPVQVQREGVRSHHRLGRHATKRERGPRHGVGAQAGTP